MSLNNEEYKKEQSKHLNVMQVTNTKLLHNVKIALIALQDQDLKRETTKIKDEVHK